jgi:hypothetical protein
MWQLIGERLGVTLNLVRLDALKTVIMKITVFLDVTTCSLIDSYQRFGDVSILSVDEYVLCLSSYTASRPRK